MKIILSLICVACSYTLVSAQAITKKMLKGKWEMARLQYGDQIMFDMDNPELSIDYWMDEFRVSTPNYSPDDSAKFISTIFERGSSMKDQFTIDFVSGSKFIVRYLKEGNMATELKMKYSFDERTQILAADRNGSEEKSSLILYNGYLTIKPIDIGENAIILTYKKAR